MVPLHRLLEGIRWCSKLDCRSNRRVVFPAGAGGWNRDRDRDGAVGRDVRQVGECLSSWSRETFTPPSTLLLLGRVAADRCRSSVGFSVVASPDPERESRLVQTEDRARLLPNTVLALGSSVLFKDKAPCGSASIGLGA